MADYWMAEASARTKQKGRQGALRRALHVKPGQNIPAARLEQAKHSPDPHKRQMANMAARYKAARHKRGRTSRRRM